MFTRVLLSVCIHIKGKRIWNMQGIVYTFAFWNYRPCIDNFFEYHILKCIRKSGNGFQGVLKCSNVFWYLFYSEIWKRIYIKHWCVSFFGNICYEILLDGVIIK